MFNTFAIIVALTAQADVPPRLLVERYPQNSAGLEIRLATDVPRSLGNAATFRFKHLEICFDGGSYGAFFSREDDRELILFFANPTYWSPMAKRDGKQPVAVQGTAGLVEIAHQSKLEARILDLLAADIVDGQRSRDATLTLIRIRDCLLKRQPLREITERFDPKTWKPRPAETSTGEDPFGDRR